jgi:hypothetical protein
MPDSIKVAQGQSVDFLHQTSAAPTCLSAREHARDSDFVGALGMHVQEDVC